MSTAADARHQHLPIDLAHSRRAFNLAPDRRPPLVEVPRPRVSLRRPLRFYAPRRIARTSLVYELR